MSGAGTPGGGALAGAGGRGEIVSINVSRKKGQKKTPVPEAVLAADRGIAGDAHEGFARRQVSLLMMESIESQRRLAGDETGEAIVPGAYAENLTTRGLDLCRLRIGDELLIGGRVRLRVTQIGKDCHTRCAIYNIVGDCIMPTQGIFCEVLEGGPVAVGDAIEALP